MIVGIRALLNILIELCFNKNYFLFFTLTLLFLNVGLFTWQLLFITLYNERQHLFGIAVFKF